MTDDHVLQTITNELDHFHVLMRWHEFKEMYYRHVVDVPAEAERHFILGRQAGEVYWELRRLEDRLTNMSLVPWDIEKETRDLREFECEYDKSIAEKHRKA